MDSYNRRSKVSLEFEVGSESSEISDLTNLSISVASGTTTTAIMDLNDYLIFGTEFGLFPWSTIKGKKITELPPEVMDSLLMTMKSNWINWKTILAWRHLFQIVII